MIAQPPRSSEPARLIRPYIVGASHALPAETVGTVDTVVTSTPIEPMPEAVRWHTMPVKRTVLVAAHTVTSLMRLEDIVLLLEDDPRVQLIFTKVPDRLGCDVEQRLQQRQDRTLSWDDAMARDFDLVIAASLHRLEDIPAKRRFAAPHGAGYNKLWPAWACADGHRPVYGLDAESLLDDANQPIVDALLLPHPDHLETLRRQCPEAVPTAVVSGDPCYDRLVACLAERNQYREKLGVRCRQSLVVVASTWGPHALLATQLDRLRRLPSEVSADHRVIATMHPAVWAEHGARQVRTWLRAAREAGVDLVDAGEDWRGLMAAADALVADHSSLTVYAASIGIPVIMTHFASGEVDPGSVLAAIAEVSPPLCPETVLITQLVAARDAQPAQWAVAQPRVAARKGVSAEVIRETMYRLLEIPQPDYPAEWPAVASPRLVRD